MPNVFPDTKFWPRGGKLNQKRHVDMTEEEKLKLAAGDDGSGVSGIGHIQLNGYPEILTMDHILITITDRQGNSTTKIIYIKVSNNEYNQTVVTVPPVQRVV